MPGLKLTQPGYTTALMQTQYSEQCSSTIGKNNN